MINRQILWLAMAALPTACATAAPGSGGASTSTQTTGPEITSTGNTNAVTVLPSDTPVAQQGRFIGRFAQDAATGQMQSSWAGSSVEVAFSGTGIQAWVGDVNVVYDYNDVTHNVLDIAIDGNQYAAVALNSNIMLTPLAMQLPSGQHILRMTKRTEALVGTTAVAGFEPINGNLLAPPTAARYHITFYGVSNETGYGDLAAVDANDMCTFSYETQDSDKAYPALAAAHLGAELINISYAGKGVINNGYPLYDPLPIPSLYNLIDPANPNLTVDFGTEPEPDVVGVDLGGNDFTNGIPDQDTFIQAYQAFLTTLRQTYPNAPIVCVMGPMMTGENRTDMSAWINSAIQARNQAGDNNITFLPFDVYTGSIYGCDYHPSGALQAQMAVTFEQQLLSVAAFGQ